MQPSMNRFGIAVVSLALIVSVAACGSDGSSASTEPVAPADTTAASAAAFPVTVAHKYGEITIDKEPRRVVSVGFTDQDWLLALGVTPIAIREWYGEQPYATWPWAQDELGDAKPAVLPSAELNFEEIAALQPDLIVGVSSGITESDYATLSEIAPTLAQPGDYVDYGTPWDVTTELIGRAVGKSVEAAAVVEHVNGLYEAARAAHPEFAGASAAVTFYFDDKPGAYSSQDSRSRIVTDLGFVIPPKFDELAGDSFFFSVSNEEMAVLDTDVVIWLVSDDTGIDAVSGIALRPSTRAYKEGRELLATGELSGAFSFGSPLSIEYTLEQLVPELALAVDGDPATAVPSAAALASTAG